MGVSGPVPMSAYPSMVWYFLAVGIIIFGIRAIVEAFRYCRNKKNKGVKE